MMLSNGKLLSEAFPLVYFVRIWQKRLATLIKWKFGKVQFARQLTQNKLPFRCMKHLSKLLRIHDDSNPKHIQWQYNKVVNLKIAASKINGVLIKPGEVFSFCNLVGLPTVKRGYLEGMELSRGEARAGIGGGICQLANLINWMAWHTDLKVIQRSHHSFDPFPDKGRVLPFGSGAAIFWNYVDLQIANTTQNTYQIVISFTESTLKGAICVSDNPKYFYHIHEKNHQFIKKGDIYYRANEIWRTVFHKGINGKEPEEICNELMVKNFAKVKYKIEQ